MKSQPVNSSHVGQVGWRRKSGSVERTALIGHWKVGHCASLFTP